MTQDQIEEKLEALEQKLNILWDVVSIHINEIQSQVQALQIELNFYKDKYE